MINSQISFLELSLSLPPHSPSTKTFISPQNIQCPEVRTKMKKIIWPGLLLGLIMLVVNFIVSYLFMLIPSVATDYTSGFMRSWQDPLMMAFFLYPFILGIILAALWDKVKTSFKGNRGCHFGWWVFLLTTVPGMYITYTSFNLTFLTILGWTVSGLISAKIAGFLLAKMNP